MLLTRANTMQVDSPIGRSPADLPYLARMNPIRACVLFLVLFSASSFVSHAQDLAAQFEATVAQKFNNGPAASALVAQAGKVTYSAVKGQSDLELGVAADGNTHFRIGSVTKQFTAVAILHLAEAGKLRLEDSIQVHLPDFPVKAHTLTLEHLLTHTSGLAEITEMPVFFEEIMRGGSTPEALLSHFQDAPLRFEPGSAFSYSNSGYHLLGLVIERASGLDYNTYVATYLLQPAGMDLTRADDNQALVLGRARGYEAGASGLVNAAYIDMSVPFSGGNLLSTAGDLMSWYNALFAYRIVSEASLDRALSPYTLSDGSTAGYGYGWFIQDLQGHRTVSHEGGINGFLSSVWYAPDAQTLAVVLSACMCNPTTQTARKLLAHALGDPLPELPRLQLPQELLETYAGTYLMDGEHWAVSIRDGELHFAFPDSPGHAIYASTPTDFYAEEWDSLFYFSEEAEGVRFRFEYLGEVVEGWKVPDPPLEHMKD